MATRKVSIVSRLNMVMIIDNKARIREAACDLFMQLGMRRVSMDDIAQALGMSKKTLYLYYADKESLVEDTVDMLLKNSSVACENCRKLAENAIHECFLVTAVLTESMVRINPVLIFDIQRYYPAAQKKIEKFRKEYLYKFFKTGIETGIRQELFKKNINPSLISWFRIETLSLQFQQQFVQDIDMDVISLQKELSLFFLHGLATPKGIKLIEKYKKPKI